MSLRTLCKPLALSTIASLAVGCSLSLASGEPATTRATSTELRKLPPNAGARPYRERFQLLIESRYPQLLTNTADGAPIVTVLLDLYGDLVRTELEISRQPPSELAASERSFSRFGLREGDLQYVGAATIQTPANTVLIVFGGMASRDLDRRLVQRFFPKVFSEGAPLNQGIWILLDHEGQVLRTGEEYLEPTRIRAVLEKRYPGIETADMTATPVVGPDGRPMKDREGRPFQLTCVWLASDSPLPKS
jgi:hypothetical protein